MNLKIVGLDIESKRRGSDWGTGTYHFRQLICADYRFSEEKTHHFLPFGFTTKQLDNWAEPLRQSGLLIVGHNVKYDMVGVNATLVERGLKPLAANVISDTMRDSPKLAGWGRRDLGSMALRYKVAAKGSVGNGIWDLAHNGDKAAQAHVRDYNLQDVDTVLELQKTLADLGLLGRPMTWKP